MQCGSCNRQVADSSKSCSQCGSPPVPSGRRGVKPSVFENRPKADPPARRPDPDWNVQLSRAERVQNALNQILKSSDLPAFSHHIHVIMGLLKSDETSLRRLANIVLNDYGLTVVLMRTANSYHYNRSGKPIRSVTHAIAMLGVNAIRHLAGSLLFLEHYRNRAVCLPELLLLATLTASHARNLARRVLPGRLEEAHLCGMLRNLGEVLVACYMPHEYATILARMKDRDWKEKEACLSVMGFSYEELAQAMARHWKLPASVSETMRAGQPGGAQQDPLLSEIVAFSHALTAAVYRERPESANRKIRSLMAHHQGIPGLRQERIAELLAAAISDTREIFAALDIRLDHLRLQQQTESALAGMGSRRTAATSANQSVPPEAVAAGVEAEVRASLAQNSSAGCSNAITIVLEGIFRGGPFDRVLLCLPTGDRKRIQGKFGLGPRIDDLAELFDAPLAAGLDPLVDALLAQRDLFVDDPERFQDSELLRSIRPACFGLYPLVLDREIAGCIYFDRILVTGPETGSSTLAVVSHLRDLAVTVISRSRTSGSMSRADRSRD